VTPPSPFRIGHGYDLHRLQSGGRLYLAGVLVAEGISPIAHSDGDVVLHAVVDALLGAMAWGDIGQWFPNTDSRWKEAPSSEFVRAVYEKVKAEGFTLANLDVTILAERPKLSPFNKAMVKSLTDLLGGLANVKAGTNEGCDSVGAGQAIAAHAMVLLHKI
jgi:2-C-methyl-D-erythritol 2,4-cyclodiphosphate synthase